jgi:hypothetical protein
MDKKEYMKKYYIKNSEKRKEYQQSWREINKDKQKEYQQEYHKTPQCKKRNRIANWKYRKIIFHDYDLLYDIYMETTHCDECKCLLNECPKSRKCIDHDHSITDYENIRGIVCNSCNIKRG